MRLRRSALKADAERGNCKKARDRSHGSPPQSSDRLEVCVRRKYQSNRRTVHRERLRIYVATFHFPGEIGRWHELRLQQLIERSKMCWHVGNRLRRQAGHADGNRLTVLVSDRNELGVAAEWT